jgi:hypothetical protein
MKYEYEVQLKKNLKKLALKRHMDYLGVITFLGLLIFKHI